MEVEKSDIQIVEPVLFTRLSEEKVLNAKISDITPIVNWIAADWDLNPKRSVHFKMIKKIIINSAKYN